MIVTVANRKGGVGKTTASVFLAHALAQATGASCVLIDADPQGSAIKWSQLAAEAGRPFTVPVLARPTPRLAGVAADAPNLVIDTPPGDSAIAASAIALADLVVIPTSASALDLSMLQATVDAAAGSGKPAAVLLTRTRRTRSVGTAEESLRGAGICVLRTHIPLREAQAMAFGHPVRQLHGYDLAVAELLDVLPEQPFSVEAVRQRAAAPTTGHPVRLSARPQPPGVGALGPLSAPRRSAPTALGDDELMQRLKASMARLAIQR